MFTTIQATYESIILASGTSFEPTLEPTDICHNCVEDTFLGTSIYPIIRFLNRGNRSHVIMSSREAIPIRTSEACCSVRCGCRRGGFYRLLDLQALDERYIHFSFVQTDSNFFKLRCRLEATETKDARAISKRPCSRLSVLPGSCHVRTWWPGAQHFCPNARFAQGLSTIIRPSGHRL